MITTGKTFGQTHFEHAQLGDKRRTDRLVALTDLMVRRPGGTLPHKLNEPKDLRAFYRLMDREEVTHEAILSAHRQATMQQIQTCDGAVFLPDEVAIAGMLLIVGGGLYVVQRETRHRRRAARAPAKPV